MEKYRKIVVASDSFKGSLSSMQVAEAVENAVHDLCPQCEVVKLPMADGGEGTLKTLVYASRGKMIECTVHDPLMRPVKAEYGIIGDRAIIEMAAASGLTLLSESERDPLAATSFGTGEMIRHALERGFRKILVTIGGSATCDAGLGAMQALGLRLFDTDGRPMPDGFAGRDMIHTGDFCTAALRDTLGDASVVAACDVNNPLYGENGAAYVYAPQKGATAGGVAALDAGLRHIARIIHRSLGMDISSLPGAGAAGGMGGALSVFLSAQMKRGVELVMEQVGFRQHAADADLIITGEGKIDRQTSMGKVVGGIAAATDRRVLVLGGRVEGGSGIDSGGRITVMEVTPRSMPDVIAMRRDVARENIEKAVRTFLSGE